MTCCSDLVAPVGGWVPKAQLLWMISEWPCWPHPTDRHTVYLSCSAPLTAHQRCSPKGGKANTSGAIFNQWEEELSDGSSILHSFSKTILGSMPCAFQEVLVDLSSCCPSPAAVSVLHIYSCVLTPTSPISLPGILLIEYCTHVLVLGVPHRDIESVAFSDDNL